MHTRRSGETDAGTDHATNTDRQTDAGAPRAGGRAGKMQNRIGIRELKRKEEDRRGGSEKKR